MATYDNGTEEKEESAEYTEMDLSYKDKYEDQADILNLLSSCQEADHDMREQAREAHLFVSKRDGQWEAYWYEANQNKPRYTFDQVGVIVSQISSEIERSDFDIRVTPAGGNATKDIAATYDGLIRNIENVSNAPQVFAQAATGMVTSGFDAWRVCQKYVDDNSFDQDIMIEKIANPIDRVWFDSAAEKQDKSDSRYAFILHPMALDEYKSRWPEGSEQSVSDDRDGDAYYDKAETVVVGEFLYLESEDRELVMMSNGQTHEVDDDFEKVVDDLALIGVTEIRRRTRKKHKVCSRYFDAEDWLEEKKETVFNRIPVIPVYGNFKIFENKSIWYGVVEKLLDPQRLLNYSLSRELEEGALAPRAKYWMTMTQAAGHENEIATLNTNSDPVQFYNVDPESPQVPQQQGGAMINPALRTMSQAMQGMIQATAGLYASSMGDNPNAQSGVAVRALQNKGDNGTYGYTRSMEIAISATGRLIKDAIPEVYNTIRTVRILREDESYDLTDLNQQVIDNATGEVVTVNDLSVGTYDVTAKAGPSFANRQEETIEAITSLAQVDPTLMQIAGDLLVQNISTPAASQIAERKRAQMMQQGLIPQSQMTEEELAEIQQQMLMAQQGQQQPDPNMVIAQAEQMKAQAEMMRAQIEQAKLQNEQMKLQIEAQKLQNQMAGDQVDNQIDAFRAETDRMDVQVKAEQAGAKVNMDEISAFGKQLDNTQKMMEIEDERMRKAQLSMLPPEALMRIANGG